VHLHAVRSQLLDIVRLGGGLQAAVFKAPDRRLSEMNESKMSYGDAYIAITNFARRIRRFGETSDAGMFVGTGGAGESPMQPGELNVQLCITGRFGDADEFFEALRVLKGVKRPRSSAVAGASEIQGAE
jgi:hypothetical protein